MQLKDTRPSRRVDRSYFECTSYGGDTIDLLEQWMEDNETDKTLQEVLISYAHRIGGTTVQELVPA